MRRPGSTSARTTVLGWLAAVMLLASAMGPASAATVWGVNGADQIWQWQGNGQWRQIPGGLANVSVGVDGTVWGVNRGGQIWSWDGTKWTQMPGALVQVSVGTRMDIWGVNASDDIWRWDGTKWTQVAGKLRNVSIGSDGTVWGVDRAGQIFSRTGDTWKQMPGALVQVAVGTAGNVWGVNASDDIWRWNGTAWTQVPGKLTNVGVAADGSVWGVNRANQIFSWDGTKWTQMPGALAQVAVGGPIVVNVNQNLNIAPPPTTVTVNAAPNITPTPTTSNMIVIEGTASLDVTPAGSVTTGASSPPPLTVGGALPTYPVGAVGSSQATCGVAGKGICAYQSAIFVHNSSSTCPTGSFMDIGRMSCWSCPSGFVRGAAAVDTARACTQSNPSQTHDYEPSTFRGYLCDEGSFYDPIRGGECWKCPSGYRRSAAHVETSNACVIPLHEDFSYATRVKRTPWPHECGSGTFWDGYDGGLCFSCPSGFRRTAYHVTDGKACAKTVPEVVAHATVVRKAGCGPGEFIDLKIPGTQNQARGGGCYTCPTAYERTIHPIDHENACWHPAGVRFASATRTQPLACEAGEFFDPISSANPLMRASLDARNARDPANHVSQATIGGTCWRCPPGSTRSGMPVYGSQACNPQGIVWKPAPYNQPGLFGLTGAEEVALKLVQERTTITAILADMKTGSLGAKQPADYVAKAWAEIATAPQDSAALKMAVFSRVVAASNNPAGATPAELQLRDAAIDHIRKFRVFMAQDALNAYIAWKQNQDWRKSQYLRSQLQNAFDVGEVPPDFEDITAESIVGSLAAAGAMDTATYLAFTQTKLFTRLFPYAQRAVFKPAEEAAKQIGTKIGTKVMAKVGTQTASGLSATVASIGPQIIITIGAEILAVAIEQQIDIHNAEPKLNTSLANARNASLDFARLMATPEGSSQAQGYWSQLMAGPAEVNGARGAAMPPRNLAAFTQSAQAAMAAL